MLLAGEDELLPFWKSELDVHFLIGVPVLALFPDMGVRVSVLLCEGAARAEDSPRRSIEGEVRIPVFP